MTQTLDRINYFQGWVIIVLIFTGIAMLKHYEDRGKVQVERFKQDTAQQRATILSNQKKAEVEMAVLIAKLNDMQKSIDRNRLLINEVKCMNGAVDTWAAITYP